MKQRWICRGCIFFLILFFDTLLVENLQQEITFFSQIEEEKILADIRDESVPLSLQTSLRAEKKLNFSQALLTYFACDAVDSKKQNALKRIWERRKPEEYQHFLALVSQIWNDVQYFPVPISRAHTDYTVSFENSWMDARSFGGKRGHEGCDIMANVGERNLYPIVSMTDGVVEQMGWLTLGGYRIGIRAPSGGYFYYAHLASYADSIEIGTEVKAGEFIGFMGDTGYGEEGTIGQFPVHLHVGIYISDDSLEECSVNPYWILRSLEDKKLQYAF